MWKMSEILRQIVQFLYTCSMRLFFSPEPKKESEMLDLQGGMEEQMFQKKFSIINPVVLFETYLDQGWLRCGQFNWDVMPKMKFILELKSCSSLFLNDISVKARLRLVDVEVMEPTKLVLFINFRWNNKHYGANNAPMGKRVLSWHQQRNNNQPEIWEKELFKCWYGRILRQRGRDSYKRTTRDSDELGHLEVNVDLSLFVGLRPATSLPLPDINDARLSSDWAEVFSNGREADVVVVSLDGQEFPTHRLVLSARSPVFCAMLKQAMIEAQEGKIHIMDFSAVVIQEFLQYIYTGRLSDEGTSLDAHSQELLAIANKYDVAGLKRKTELFLAGNLNMEDALELLCLGDTHQAEILTATAAAFVRQNISFFMMGKHFSRLAREKPHLLNMIIH